MFSGIIIGDSKNRSDPPSALPSWRCAGDRRVDGETEDDGDDTVVSGAGPPGGAKKLDEGSVILSPVSRRPLCHVSEVCCTGDAPIWFVTWLL